MKEYDVVLISSYSCSAQNLADKMKECMNQHTNDGWKVVSVMHNEYHKGVYITFERDTYATTKVKVDE